MLTLLIGALLGVALFVAIDTYHHGDFDGGSIFMGMVVGGILGFWTAVGITSESAREVALKKETIFGIVPEREKVPVFGLLTENNASYIVFHRKTDGKNYQAAKLPLAEITFYKTEDESPYLKTKTETVHPKWKYWSLPIFKSSWTTRAIYLPSNSIFKQMTSPKIPTL